MNNKAKILFYDMENYTLAITSIGEVSIISKHKRNYGNSLAQWLNPDGYLMTKINSKGTTVHSVVCRAAHGERPAGLVINHKDGDKLNNHPNNLEYCTITDNIKHAIANNLHVVSNGKGMPTYIDGRCADKAKYKHNHYLNNRDEYIERASKYYYENRERILEKRKLRYKESVSD